MEILYPGVSINTVTKLLVEVGQACSIFDYETVKCLNTKRAELDECWSFVGKKQGHVVNPEKGDGEGDAWTWIAMDPDSKLVISWLVGNARQIQQCILLKTLRAD